MKKLLAVLLSTTMLLSALSGALSVTAAVDENGYIHPAIYDGIFPESEAGVFGFEESGHWYGYTMNSADWSIDSDAATGKGSLKVDFGNDGESGAGILMTRTGDISSYLNANLEYFIKSKVKTSPDFDGKINIRFSSNLNDPWETALANSRSYTSETWFFNKTGSNFDCCGTVLQSKGDFSDWQTIRSYDIMQCVYNGDNKLASKMTGEDAGIILQVNGSKGSVWLDDISLDFNGNYNGDISEDKLDQNYVNGNGGFENSHNPWTISYEMNDHAEGSGTCRRLWQSSETAHSGMYSGKFVIEEQAAGKMTYGGFRIPLTNFEADKDYYAEMWVKLEDSFNGSICLMAGNIYGERIWVDYSTDLWMLGNGNENVKGTEFRDGWVLLRTPVIPASAIAEYKGKTGDTAANLMIEFRGTGTFYLDDFDLKTVEDNTPRFTPNQPQKHSVFQNVSISTTAESDIYYTLDGSDPRYSKSAKLYDSANPLVLTEELFVEAVAMNRETGEFSDIVGSHYPVDTSAFNMTLNTATDAKKDSGHINFNSHNNYHMSFDLTTSELVSNEVTAKLFLVGYGTESYITGGETYTGAWAGKSGYLYKTSANGTYKVAYDINDMDGLYSACILVLEASSSVGTAATSNVEFTTVQNSLPEISVTETSNPYLNYYFDDEVISKELTVKNNTAYLQTGVIEYTVTNSDNSVVETGTIDVDGLEKYTSDIWTIEILKAKDYDTYKVKYEFTSSVGKTSNSGEFVSARIHNNSSIVSNSNTGISSHVMGWDAKSDAEYNTMFSTYAKLGIRYLRIDAFWDRVETEKGVYTLPEHWSRIINAAVNNGLEPILIVNAFNNDLYSEDTIETKATAFSGFAAYLAENLSNVKYFECINEGNLFMSAADYATVLKKFYPAVKAKNANAQILAGNVSNHGGTYLADIVAADSTILDYMDIWSVHPYASTWSADGSYEELNNRLYAEHFAALKANYLDAKGIALWAGEFGYPVCDTFGGVDSTESAAYTVRAYMAMDKSGIDNVIQYTVDGGEANYYTESNYGVLDTDSKETSVAIDAYNMVMDGYTLSEAVVNGTNRTYVYRYNNGINDMYALWTTGAEASYQLSFSEENYAVIDMYGNKIDSTVEAGENGFLYNVAIGSQPVYVMMDDSFTPEHIVYNNIVNGGFENGEAGFYHDGHSLDDKVVYDGSYSQKVDFDVTNDQRIVLSVNTENFDVSKRYYLQFKARASSDYSGTFSPTIHVNREGSTQLDIWSEWYNGDFYAIGSKGANATIPTTWKNYTSPSFWIFGDKVDIVITAIATGGKMWLDNFEMVPVEGTGCENGIVTSRYDSSTGKFVLTAKADKGYKPDTMNVKLCIPYAQTDVPTVVSEMSSVSQTSYEFSVDGYNLIARESYGQLCTATFSEAAVTLMGDCNKDNQTDVRDLVRLKKYLSKATFDIELVNVDYDKDDIVNSTELVNLKKQIIGVK